MTYSKFSRDMLEQYGGTKKNSLSKILQIKDKNYTPTNDALVPADYHDTESFIKALRSKKDTISTVSLNVESLKSKLTDLKAFIDLLQRQDCRLDAILIQETWLTDEQCKDEPLKDYKLPGYQTIALGRKCGRKGGLIIYLNDSFTYTRRDLYESSKIWEGIFIDITHKYEQKLPQKITLANIYRPGRDNNSTKSIKLFLKPFKEIMLKLYKENSTIVTGGDFNINLMELTSREIYQEYFDLFVSNGALPSVTLPTRFAKRRATLIDQIFCRFSKYTSLAKAGIIVTKISDHLPCFSIINYTAKINAKPKYVKVCKKGPNEMDAFLKEFSDKLELETFISDPLADPTINYSKLEEIITTSKQNSFPETVVKFNKYKHRLQPWITFDILNQIRSRDNLYIRLKNTNPDSVKFTQLEDQLKSHIITLKKAIRDAKQKYYHKQFENFKTNIKQTWNKINEILSRNKRDSELPSYFCEGNNVITSNQDIANCFNNFFSKIGPALAQTIKGPPGKSYKDYLKKNNI